MPSHKATAQHDRAKWQLRVLVPAWILQLLLAMAIGGLFGWRLGYTLKHSEEAKDWLRIDYVWEITNTGLSVITIISTFYEIARYLSEALTPWTMLFTQTLKLTCAIAILVLDSIIYANHTDANYSLAGLVLDAVLIITAVSLAIYAVLSYRRLSLYENFGYTTQVPSYGYYDEDAPRRQTSYASKLSTVRPSISQRRSVASDRSGNDNGNTDLPTENASITPPNYYSHQRNTDFEEYIARRASLSAEPNVSKFDVESALDAEFGWNDPSAGGRRPSTSDSSVLSSGTMENRPRQMSRARAPSWLSDHILVSVPEEEQDLGVTHGDKTAQQALLGGENDRRCSGESMMGEQVAQVVDPYNARRW